MAYQVKADTDPLERERREIERRRARFEDRKARILHAKTRVMGVDTDALDQQVQERKERERAEKDRELSFDLQSLQHAKTMTGYEEQRKHDNRNRLVDLASYHKDQHYSKQASDSTAKLSYTSYSIPSSSPDSAYSNSSTVFLQFAGEDPTATQRLRLQQQQQSDWIASQLRSLSMKEKRSAEEEADYARFQLQILEIQKENEEKKRKQDAERRKMFQQTNVQLAAEKKERERQAKQLDSQMNQYELTSTLRSAFLNEQPGAAGDSIPSSSSSSSRPSSSSALSSSGSVVAYGFKGFSTAQRQAILDEQAAQQQYLRERRMIEKEEEKEYATEQEAFRRESVKLQRKKREEDARRRGELAKERIEQDKEKQEREAYLKKVVYTNPVSEDFFKQFGTSCR